MTPSPAYHAALEASKEIHKGKQFTGKFLRPHAPFIKEIIDRLGCKTVLDYGCGKGQQYDWIIPALGIPIHEWWDTPVNMYDPAYPPYAKEPEGKFDLVICTQVLGAIPEGDRGWVVDRLYSLASKAIYVSERLHTPRKIIGDNSKRPDWTVEDWKRLLERTSETEMILATRVIDENENKITTHDSCFWAQWIKVKWPPGVRAMNHKWTPENA